MSKKKYNGQTIELESKEVISYRKTTAYNVLINDKSVAFTKSVWEYPEDTGNDFDLEEKDRKKLTEEEYDALEDYINDL